MRMGSLLGVIYDIHRVRTNPEVRIGEFGASHDPGGGVNTKNLYFLSKKWAMKCIRNIPSKTDWPLAMSVFITTKLVSKFIFLLNQDMSAFVAWP